MLIVESYEATYMRSGDMVFTFDTDNFRPTGDLVSALVDARGFMTIAWSSGASVQLPDVRGKMAAWVALAPVISVQWMADGLLRGADFRQAPQRLG